jgi:hypothetical protein
MNINVGFNITLSADMAATLIAVDSIVQDLLKIMGKPSD